MVNILMTTHNKIPDSRIEKEAQSLRNAGYNIFLATPGVDDKKAEESFDKVFTYSHTYKHNTFQRSAIKEATKFYEKIIQENKIQIIHAHNIYTAFITLKIIKKCNLKFIFDDHETWSLWLKERARKAVGFKTKLFRFYIYLRARAIERKIAQKADLIITTNKNCFPFYMKLGIPKEKLIALQNIALQSEIDLALSSKNLVVDFFKKDKRKKVVHVYRQAERKNIKQSMQDETINRNFDVYVQAMEKLPNWVLVLFGKKNPELEKRGVVFIDYMPRIAYMANVAFADVGINPLVITEKTKISSQNRIFEYVKLGIRVISTETPLLKENFDDKLIWFNPDESVEKLVGILENIDQYPSGKELQKYSQKFSWEKEAEKMIAVYKNLIL